MSATTSLQGQISGLDAEIRDAEENMKKWQSLRDSLVTQKAALVQQLNQSRMSRTNNSTNGKNGIDYTSSKFEWTQELKTRMKKIFGIDSFRLCQQGRWEVVNISASCAPGCTLVISPLISLIQDQIMHLQEAGVEAVMATGSMSTQETSQIYNRLVASAAVSDSRPVNEIKLIYVTPEKLSKSKTFQAKLQKLSGAGKLARIVIDEAHCVSQLGHDFRPDYKKLSILRQLFPGVPILALSATCPPKVLEDLLKTLRMRAVVDGRCAPAEGTVYFTASLYRKNLHYSVLLKPSSAQAVIKAMADYILSNYPKDTGIVYCLAKKDAASVASDLHDVSGGKIKTGVYHSEVPESEKEKLHKRWRKGEIQVVCATIAFGLGIDKGDVRFVLHHSMSKSMEGFYQESGRAGRDGRDSDCVLYYRVQDAVRLSGMVYEDVEGQPKLYDMLRFAHDLKQCRKIQFANYFSMSSHISLSSWATEDEDTLARCGHCDNCTRDPQAVEHKDVTLEAWQVLRVAEAIKRGGGLETLNKLADLVRGAGGGAFETKGGGKKRGRGKAKELEKNELDLEEITGGKVSLSKDDTERLLVELLLSQYLVEEYKTNAYAINVYVSPGPRAISLTRWNRDTVEQQTQSRVKCDFLKKSKTGRKSITGDKASTSGTKAGPSGKSGSTTSKGNKKVAPVSSSEEEDYDDLRSRNLSGDIPSSDPVIVDGDDEDDWAFSFRSAQPPTKKLRTGTASTTANKPFDVDEDVIDLLSD